MRNLGYTRVSTSSQDAQLQLDALVAAGVHKRDVFADVTSGTRAAIERPGMKKLLEYADEGDTVVWRIDRLGRSLIDVLNTVNMLSDRGILVRSLSDGIDPTTSTGRLMRNRLAPLAEYERELIVERIIPASPHSSRTGRRSGGQRSARRSARTSSPPPPMRALKDGPRRKRRVSWDGAERRFTAISKQPQSARASQSPNQEDRWSVVR
jgi:DNA invertase Pin-like site-specific DNA recombinase